MDLIILCCVISFLFPKRSTGELLSAVTSYWNQSANSVRVGMVVYVHVLEQSKERFYWVCYVFEVAETNTLI